MNPRQAVLCPKCGARNRPTWEFCARCNESLEGAAPAETGPESRGAVADEAAPSAFAPTVVALLGLVGALLGGAWAWRTAAAAPVPKTADPSLFTMGTQPVERPVPPPPSATGAVAYAAGRRLLQAGDAQGAAAQFAAAIDADPTNAAYRDASATALWTLGNREAAIAAHAEAARLDPRLQLTYARALDVAGRSAEAAREYEAILQRNPQATTVREDFGRLLFRTGDFGRAAPYLQSAVQQRPDDFVLRQELAYAFDKAGHRDQAVAAYREVLAKAPQAVVSRGLLADNLVAAGHKDEALALLREGLRLNPGLPLLQRQVGAVLEASGQQTAAASAYREYARLAPNAADARELTDRAARLDAQRPQP